MTTLEAPESHLRENPFDIAREQLRRVADIFNIDQRLVNVLQECKKAVVVSIPVTMDDGTIQAFEGFRVTHNIAHFHVIHIESALTSSSVTSGW